MDSTDFAKQSEVPDCLDNSKTGNQSITELLGTAWRRVSMSDDEAFSVKRRLVAKNGERNIIQTDIHHRRHSYLTDIFVTLVDARWRFILLMFLSGFILSWLTFALLWWLVLLAHNDFRHLEDEDWTPCVDEVVDFPTALLFSIETQHTIGYGTRATTSKCPEAIILMMLQSAGGTLMTAILTGIVFSKIQRPKRRSHTLIFSKNAVVCMREGNLCLLFRVGDMRREHMIGTQIRAIKVRKGITKEGEVLPLFEQEVAFHVPPNGVLFLVWPATACHVIDKNSPFYNMSKDDLKHEKFELIVIMEGTIEATGMTAQVRTSYLPSEILWGHRFRRLNMYQKDTGECQIRYNNFHSAVPVETPCCSAKVLAEHSNTDPNSTIYHFDNDDTIPTQYVSAHLPIPSFNRSVTFDERGNTVHVDCGPLFKAIDSNGLNKERSEVILHIDSIETTLLPNPSNTTQSSIQTDHRIVSEPTLQVRAEANEDFDEPRILKRSKGNRVFTITKCKDNINLQQPSKPRNVRSNPSRRDDCEIGALPNTQL
ncbi:unnamed protein product [Owenia fusiformis]|uniref:Uncharacterized protein n=1 Tax=Owenia fusiformis TaxID=6347 RepID=A0A8J1TI13_OWEFU|nr:unnamed protein product [Owenia fusiformis]